MNIRGEAIVSDKTEGSAVLVVDATFAYSFELYTMELTGTMKKSLFRIFLNSNELLKDSSSNKTIDMLDEISVYMYKFNTLPDSLYNYLKIEKIERKYWPRPMYGYYDWNNYPENLNFYIGIYPSVESYVLVAKVTLKQTSEIFQLRSKYSSLNGDNKGKTYDLYWPLDIISGKRDIVFIEKNVLISNNLFFSRILFAANKDSNQFSFQIVGDLTVLLPPTFSLHFQTELVIGSDGFFLHAEFLNTDLNTLKEFCKMDPTFLAIKSADFTIQYQNGKLVVAKSSLSVNVFETNEFGVQTTTLVSGEVIYPVLGELPENGNSGKKKNIFFKIHIVR